MQWKSEALKDHTIECWNCEGAGESENESCRECFGTGQREVDADSYAPDTWKEAEGIA
jgi:DnaJ-class molecular chaperone